MLTYFAKYSSANVRINNIHKTMHSVHHAHVLSICTAATHENGLWSYHTLLNRMHTLYQRGTACVLCGKCACVLSLGSDYKMRSDQQKRATTHASNDAMREWARLLSTSVDVLLSPAYGRVREFSRYICWCVCGFRYCPVAIVWCHLVSAPNCNNCLSPVRLPNWSGIFL